MIVSDKPAIILDVELYPNYFLIMVKKVGEDTYSFTEKFHNTDIQHQRLSNLMSNYKIVTFNGNSYDLPVIAYALTGATNRQLKELSDSIIVNGAKSWEVETMFNFSIPRWESIDLIEVAPGQASLKIYGGRLHSKRLQDLPIEPSALISAQDRELLKAYCKNDLRTTEDLYNKLKPQLDLREKMSVKYSMDLMSKSDAQIAEAVIVRGVTNVTNVRTERQTVKPGTKFSYAAPGYIQYRTAEMKAVYDTVLGAKFSISDAGKVEMPPEIENLKIAIGSSVYRMGIGGLHSSESKVSHVVDGTFTLEDYDVTSYYPSMIINMKLAPENMGTQFIDVYKHLYVERLRAKASVPRLKNELKLLKDDVEIKALEAELDRDTTIMNSAKTVLNASFGKFGSKYSRMYSPNLLIQVTVTGQLLLLMLIETFELAGIPVISANTDGIVIKCPTERKHLVAGIIKDWEVKTGLTTEDTHYSALYSRDVNNYIAVKTDGKSYKTKGVFAAEGLQKNPTSTICVDAVVNYLLDGKPLIDTLLESDDIRKFITIRQVKGGGAFLPHFEQFDLKERINKVIYVTKHGFVAAHDDLYRHRDWVEDTPSVKLDDAVKHSIKSVNLNSAQYLGKAVRWYYRSGSSASIIYKSNGNKVARSDGVEPLMELPERFPQDIDYRWYHDEAVSLLNDIGVTL